MSLVSAFNKILIEFAKNLETTFPEDSDFLVFRRGIEELVKYNSLAGVQLFKIYLEPSKHGNEIVDVKQKLLDGDTSFFLEEMDYSNKLAQHASNDQTSFNTIDKLKKYWTKLTEQGKATVMKYLSTLVKVSDQIK